MIPLRGNNLFGIQAGKWRIVLMHALHGHPVRRSPGPFRQRRSPGDVGIVQQPGPIHRAQDDRLTGAEDYQSNRF